MPVTAIVIGRNEGERLAACLESLGGRPQIDAVVYVDSGSTDDSVALARGMGATVIELDLSVPFTAARARNAGLRVAQTPFALVMDGDCTLVDGFLESALNQMDADERVAVVCGQRLERHPEASLFNRLCAIEWARPAGETDACGGDALLRTDAVAEVGRYADDLIAGEEPEMCHRLRTVGYRIIRTADAMTWHDAAMTSPVQWWNRTRRSGYAYAEGQMRHGRMLSGFRAREVRGIVLWGGLLPLLAALLAWGTSGLSLVALAVAMLIQTGRILDRRMGGGATLGDALLYAVSCTLGKFPQMQGVAEAWGNRIRGRRGTLIEYKTAAVREGDRPTIGYLTSEYPKPSHTFVRRELVALESLGWDIERFSVRRFAGSLADPADQTEAERTHVLLDRGLLLGAPLIVGRMLLTRPIRFVRATAAMFGLYRQSQRSLVQHAAYLIEACRLTLMCEDRGVRHLHVHFGKNAADVALLASKLGEVTYSLMIHGPGEFDASAPFALGEKVAGSAFTTAISSFATAQLRRWVRPEHWGRLHIVRCTIGEDFLGELSPVTQEQPRIVCVGRLTGQKGQLLLAEAVARLVGEGVPIHLTLAGDGELRGAIEAVVAKHGLQEHITITGWVSEAEVRRLIRESRGLVLPSFAEGLPVAIMEALAMGRPVVSTMIAGIPELVRGWGADRNGWLFPAGDVDAVADAIRELAAADCDTLTAMGRAGHQAVAVRHRTAIEAAKLDALLRERFGLPTPPSETRESAVEVVEELVTV